MPGVGLQEGLSHDHRRSSGFVEAEVAGGEILLRVASSGNPDELEKEIGRNGALLERLFQSKMRLEIMSTRQAEPVV